MTDEHIKALLAAGFLAVGAVVVIVLQHNSATSRVLAALGGGSGGASAMGAGLTLGTAASLAGTPTPGQAGSASVPSIQPLNINPGYSLQ